MADKKISEATADDSVTGVEKVPVDDGGSAKFATTAQIKDYVLAQIAALSAASGVNVSNDGVYLLKDGALKPIDMSTFVDSILRFAFAKAGASELTGNEIFAIKNGSSLQTVTISVISEWIANNVTLPVDIDGLSGADALSNANFTIVSQGGSNKKVSFSDVKSFVINGIFSAAASDIGIANADQFLVFKDGVLKKVPRSSAGIGGDVIGPSSSTEGNVPLWDSTQKKLKNGLPVATFISANPTGTKLVTESAAKEYADTKGDVKKSGDTEGGKIAKWTSDGRVSAGETVTNAVRDTTSASDDRVPTEKAVAQRIDDISGVAPPDEHQAGYVPAWESVSNNKLTGGFQVKTSVSAQAQSSDSAIVTEKAIADKLAEDVVAPPLVHVENAIPVWGAANELKSGKTIATVLGDSTASNERIPTEKAVRDALPVVATSSNDGLITSSDKQKLDAAPNLSSIPEIGGSLEDEDTLIVKDGGAGYKKSLLSRLWAYISGKFSSYPIDYLGEPNDTIYLNASEERHGLCPKLSGNANEYLDGSGSFSRPPGLSDFTGDSGEGGVHGLVPAPSEGDAEDGKMLCANGNWVVPPSASGVDIHGATQKTAASSSDEVYVYDVLASAYRKTTVGAILEAGLVAPYIDTLFVPAAAMTPSDSSGAVPGAIPFENVTHDTMAFSNGEDTKVEFPVVMPDGWDGLGIKVKLLWTCNTATAEAGQVVAFDVGAVSYGNGDAVSGSPLTTTRISDSLLAVNQLHKTDASEEITVEGSVADNNLLHFTIERVAAYSTGGSKINADVLLLGAVIQFTRSNSYTRW